MRMKKSKFTEEQIIGALKEAEKGVPIAEVCRKIGVSTYTFYKWRQKFTGVGVTEARRMRELEAENLKLKRLVANQALDIVALKDVLTKKW